MRQSLKTSGDIYIHNSPLWLEGLWMGPDSLGTGHSFWCSGIVSSSPHCMQEREGITDPVPCGPSEHSHHTSSFQSLHMPLMEFQHNALDTGDALQARSMV